MKVKVFFLFVCLLGMVAFILSVDAQGCSGAYPCYGEWDSTADFSLQSNPNGVWSYRHGGPGFYGELLRPYVGILFGSPELENAWTWTPESPWIPFVGYWPGWGPGNDGADLNELTSFGPVLIRWVSPYTGWMWVQGSLWQMADEGRQMAWTLLKNDIVEATGAVPWDGVTLLGKANRVTFDEQIPVATGDKIDLRIDGNGPHGSGVNTFAAHSLFIRPIYPPCSMDLTIEVNPVHIDSVTPRPGLYAAGLCNEVPLQAQERYVACPEVWLFDHWEGDVADPYSAETAVLMNQDKTVTAVYVDGRVCGDECHPIIPVDLEPDCVIDLKDFAIIARHWLESTHPEDD